MEMLNSGPSTTECAVAIVIEPDVNQDSIFLSKIDTICSGFKWQLVDEIQSGVGLVFRQDGLALRNAEQSYGDVRVDFLSSALAYRKAHGGGKGELLAKAIGIKGANHYTVLDATAGLGKDAFLLASVGCEVMLSERSPLVAALLEDALCRLNQHDDAHWLSNALTLVKGDSMDILKSLQVAPDAIYLDPMFPHRKKSALVKKEMQVLQSLLGVDPDADRLLEPALAAAKQRVVVKRPAKAAYLAEKKPNMSMQSKKHRFDIYLK
jgi:16S rRNA (guanine1516-N2)-methyltransferase